MSGHSKWSQIKRQKGVADVKRGALFTKLAREIIVAARQGGGDPDANFRLRLAIQKARENNMPMENIERAVKRGTGGGEEGNVTELTYEGYGPGGAAILVQAMTDNRNRTASEVRNVFTRAGGNLAESGSVAWNFEPKGVITITDGLKDPEDAALLAIDAGAEDVKVDDGSLEIYTKPEDVEVVKKALEDKKLKVSSSEVSMVAKVHVEQDVPTAIKTLRLLDKLEELDDVQRVFSNVDFPDEAIEQYEG